MPESYLSHDEFFTKLGELFAARKGKDHGTVHLSQKRLTFNTLTPLPTADAPLADIEKVSPDTKHSLIIHATDGKSAAEGGDRRARTKLRTVVEPDALEAFYARYAEVCKAGMAGLKPRDRSKRKTKGKKKKAAVV